MGPLLQQYDRGAVQPRRDVGYLPLMPATGVNPVAPRRVVSPFAAGCSVAILLIFSQLSIVDRQLIALLVKPIKHDLDLSDTQLGLLQGLAFAFTYAVAGLPIGWAVDRFPRRLILYLGVTGWSISAVCCGLARNYVQMFVARSMVGMGEACVAPSAVSLIGDLYPPEKAGIPMGFYSAGYSLGSGVALLTGGLVVGLFNGRGHIVFPLLGEIAAWQAAFLVTGLPGVAIALLAFAIRDPGRPPAPARQEKAEAVEESGFGSFVRRRGRVIFCTYLAFALSTLIAYSIGAWTPAYLDRVFGWNSERIGATFGLVLGGAGLTGNLIGGVLIDRVFRKGVRDASLIVPAVTALVGAPFLIGAYFMASAPACLGMLAIGLVAFSSVAPASYVTWRMIAPPQFRGRLTSGFIMISSIFGIGVGPFAVGFVTDRIFRNEHMVGSSIAFVLAITLPLMIVMLLAGRVSLRAAGDIPST